MTAVFLTLFFYTLQFFGCFFPPNTLQFTVASPLGSARLLIWSSIGYLAFKEFYIYANEGQNRPNSTVQPEYLWLPVMIAALESFITYKWLDRGYYKYTGTIELWIKMVWVVGLTIILSWITYLKYFKTKQRTIGKLLKEEKVD